MTYQPNFILHKKSKEKGDSAIPTCLTLIKDHYLLTIWALYSVSNMDFSFPCVPLCQFVFAWDMCTFHQSMETCNISNVGKSLATCCAFCYENVERSNFSFESGKGRRAHLEKKENFIILFSNTFVEFACPVGVFLANGKWLLIDFSKFEI